MKKVVVHIGFGKTGTTLFQKHLFKYHPQINYLGGIRKDNITSVKPLKKNIYSLLRAILTHDSCEFDLQFWRSFYEKEIYTKFEKDKINLISEEWMSLTPVLLACGDRGLVAQRLFDIFQDDAKIIMFIRNQIDVLRSLYNNHLDVIIPLYSRDHSWNFRHQFDELMFYKLLIQTADYGILSNYRYFSLAQKYFHLFQDNVSVKLYEDFNRDQVDFLRTLANEMGINDSSFLENLPEKKVKMSYPKRGMIAEMKKLFAQNIHPDVFKGTDVFSGNYQGLKNISSNEANNFVFEYFQENNRKMSNLIKVDLAEYGYPVWKG